MGFFKKTPQEIKEQEEKKLAEAQRREEAIRKYEEQRLAEELSKTPAGQARLARNSGLKIFQISLPLIQTTINSTLFAINPTKTISSQHGSTIDSIEAEGWKLEHAGYVYQVLGSVTKKPAIEAGLKETIHGEVLGIYIFRLNC